MTYENDRYRELFDSLPVGIYKSTPDGRFLDVNRTLVEMAGYPTRELLLAAPVASIWAEPDERNVFLERLGRAGVVTGHEMRVRRYDGSTMWIRNSVRVLRDSAGGTVYEGVVEDVDERKRAEESLARIEEQYHRMIDTSPEPIAVHRKGWFVHVNPAAMRLVGATDPAQVLGRPILDFVHPDFRKVVLERVRRGYEEGKPGELLEERFLRLDGTAIDVEVASLPSIWKGEPATKVLIRDVTERHEAERRLRESEARLAEAQKIAALGTWELDPEQGWCHASEELFRMAGVVPRAEGISYGETLNLIHPDDRALVEEILRRAIEKGEPFAFDYRYLRPDGHTRAVHTRGEVFRDGDGRVVRVVGTAQDVTDRKQIERELAQARDTALEASRLKSSFLANMSHEIRTPLNVIVGYTSLLADYLAEIGDHSQDGLFEGIDRAGRRLMDTVHGVLDLSKIETGTFSIEPRPLDVAEVLNREIHGFEVLAARRGLTLRLELEEPVCVVPFDAYCLSQALANLLSNALKFTAEGGVTVRLFREPDGNACVEVSDTGVGIDATYLPRLFEAFSQEQSGYAREFEGTGLGLALTRRYVELNDGRVTAESEKGRGSRFRIHLPKGVAMAPAADAGVSVETAPVQPPTANARPRVLVVEDEPDTQVYMKAMLGDQYEVSLAATAEDARTVLDREGDAVQVVLMDLSLRGSEDGLSLTRSIRQDPRFRSLPIIATTAHAFLEDRERSLDAGCDAYLPKPISPRVLLRTIARLLAG